MAIDRKKLTEIIEMEKGINWWKPELFESKIKSLLPAELRIVSNPPLYEHNYNCFVYAFGLQNDPEFLGGKNPIQQEFIRWLILNKILIPVEIAKAGSLVFYRNVNDDITHAGIMQNDDMVISKWMWGPTVIHGLQDVPSSFGDRISFFNSPETDIIKRQYFIYKDTGVKIKPIE